MAKFKLHEFYTAAGNPMFLILSFPLPSLLGRLAERETSLTRSPCRPHTAVSAEAGITGFSEVFGVSRKNIDEFGLYSIVVCIMFEEEVVLHLV